jgi:hypothetical protein
MVVRIPRLLGSAACAAGLVLCASLAAAAPNAPATSIVLGPAVVSLDGPWKFHTGDDTRWAEPGFDDSGWEDMALGAPPDANDGDVGITPYTAGWGAKGHPDYHGYAWYRLRITVDAPADGTIALLGPWAVDSVYQVYADDTLLGGVGDFSGTTPTAYGTHYPKFFALPPALAHGGPLVLAIRVWSGPWTGADGGGIHVAPAIGEKEAIFARYRLQWLKIFEGYVVDAVPALLFVLMALLVLCLWPFERGTAAFGWLAAALLLSGIQRGNQSFFFWWQIETIREFVYIITVMVGSLSLGAWVMAWRAWLKVERPHWLPRAVAALTLTLIVAQALGYTRVFGASWPHWAAVAIHELILGLRWAFLSAFLLVAYQGIRGKGREAWYTLPAILAIGAVLFASELSTLHVPGIWFPYGVGVSLSEYMSIVFDVLLFGLLLRRLWSHAHSPTHPEIFN